jgi:hypothetical protein
MNAYGGVDVYIHIFLTSALAGGEWSASRSDRFIAGERAPGTHWIGGWVDPRTGLDVLENGKFLTLPGLELQPLGRPARSQSLYRLSYPGSQEYIWWHFSWRHFFLSSKRLFFDAIKISEGATLRVHGDHKGTIICLFKERKVKRQETIFMFLGVFWKSFMIAYPVVKIED